MQVAAILMGCILGFGAGVFAFVGLGLGLFMSLSIWAASGPLSVLLLAGLSGLSGLRPAPSQTQSAPQAEVA